MKTLRLSTIITAVVALMLLAACSSQQGLGRHSANGGEKAAAQTTEKQKGLGRKAAKPATTDKASDAGTTASESKKLNSKAADAGTTVSENKEQDGKASQPSATAGRRRGRKSKKAAQEEALLAEEQAHQALADSLKPEDFLQKVTGNAQAAHFITSKVKFSVEVGNRQMTLTGNLKMKRDDVIRLQLMAFGFVEAGRLEFTKEYVLVMDRINKLYLKVPYGHLDFLRNSNIDFNVLQALFWNELLQVDNGKAKSAGSKDKPSRSYTTELGSDEVVIALDADKLSYRWLADNKTAQVKMANILYSDRFRGNYQLNWDYDDFKYSNHKLFPMSHRVTFTAPEKEVRFSMTLNYMGADEDWETRTTISAKYRQVGVDEILRRFMSL